MLKSGDSGVLIRREEPCLMKMCGNPEGIDSRLVVKRKCFVCTIKCKHNARGCKAGAFGKLDLTVIQTLFLPTLCSSAAPSEGQNPTPRRRPRSCPAQILYLRYLEQCCTALSERPTSSCSGGSRWHHAPYQLILKKDQEGSGSQGRSTFLDVPG